MPTSNAQQPWRTTPDFIPQITASVTSSKQRLRIACDYPGYGFFSSFDEYLQYSAAIKLRQVRNVDVQMIFLDEKRQALVSKNQFNGSWSDLTRTPRFHERLKTILEFHAAKGEIASPARFRSHFAELQRKIVDDNHLGDVKRIRYSHTIFPLHLWIFDAAHAIFSIPTFEPEATEYAFETRDQELIKSLSQVWDLYSAWFCSAGGGKSANGTRSAAR